MAKTTIYLDVDGVINAITRGRGFPVEPTGWADWKRVHVHDFWITYSVELIDRINVLATRDDVEVKWLTTWCDLARTAMSPGIGIHGEDWAVLGAAELAKDHKYRYYSDSWWKFDALVNDLTEGDRAVWLDDDLDSYRGSTRNWEKENESRVLCISPNTGHGLTIKHLEQIEAFCS